MFESRFYGLFVAATAAADHIPRRTHNVAEIAEPQWAAIM
jgi:hypothetical protein